MDTQNDNAEHAYHREQAEVARERLRALVAQASAERIEKDRTTLTKDLEILLTKHTPEPYRQALLSFLILQRPDAGPEDLGLAAEALTALKQHLVIQISQTPTA